MIEFSLRHRVKRPDLQHHDQVSAASNKPPLLIFLHGVGGHEDEFLKLADQFDHRFVLISARGPFEQSPSSFAWFRISPFPDERAFFIDDAEESRQRMIQFINESVANYDVDPDQIYLFGFDQGATIALSVMLTEPALLSGVVAMSGEVLPEVLHMRVSKSMLRDFPVFLAYGLHDQTLPIQDGRKMRDLLAVFTDDIRYREYPVGRQVTSANIQDASDWLTQKLDANRKTWFAQRGSKVHLGHIQITVRDLDRSITFYKRFLNLRLSERLGRSIAFLSSSYHHHDLALQAIGPEAIDMSPNMIGLTNIAFEAEDAQTFAQIYKNLVSSGILVRTADHFISWSFYFKDPDGNELEVYLDTRDLHGRSDMWRGRDLPLETEKILSLLNSTDNDVSS
jgi:phospholipase/carboxylesterase